MYFAPRGYPGAKKAKGDANQTQQQAPQDFEAQVAAVKKELPPAQATAITNLEANLAAAKTPQEKAVALDSLTRAWDKLMRPFIAAKYSFDKSEIINTFAAWFETGNRFYSLTAIIPANEQEQRTALFSQAKEAYTKAQAFDTANTVVKTRIAVCDVEGTDPMTGVLALRNLAEKDSTNAEAQLNLGLFSARTNQLDKAEKRFRTYVRLAPNDKEGLFYLADILAANGKNKEAVTYFKKYITLNPGNSAENEQIEKRINELLK